MTEEYITLNNILAVVQILTLVFLILYVIKTWQMATATRKYAETSDETLKEMKDSRIEEYSPYMVVFFDFVSGDIDLVIRNAGRGLARNIRINFTPELNNTRGRLQLPFLDDGISFMPPNHEIRSDFDNFADYKNANLEMNYTVRIEYDGAMINNKIEEYSLNLNNLSGLRFTITQIREDS